MKREISLLSFGAVLLWLASPAFPQDCASLMQQGIYNYRYGTGSKDEAESFANWFCDSAEHDASTLEKTGTSVGIPFLTFGHDSGRETFEHWARSTCASAEGRRVLKSTFSQNAQTIDAQLVKVMGECLRQPGVHTWVTTTADPLINNFCAQYVPHGEGLRHATIKTFKVQGAQCDPDFKGWHIDPGGLDCTACARFCDGRKALAITVNTKPSSVKDRALSLPSVSSPSPVTAREISTQIFAGYGGWVEAFPADHYRIPQGSKVTVDATGKTCLNTSNQRDPNSFVDATGSKVMICEGVGCGALLLRLDADPAQGRVGTPFPVGVGGRWEGVVTGGYLMLHYADSAYVDNSGTYDVRVAVTAPAPPQIPAPCPEKEKRRWFSRKRSSVGSDCDISRQSDVDAACRSRSR